MNFITTLIIQTLTKKNPSDVCFKPKKLYKVYKLYNAKQNKKLNIGKNLKPKFKTFKLQNLLIEKENLKF
jgi:hypothetical protein